MASRSHFRQHIGCFLGKSRECEIAIRCIAVGGIIDLRGPAGIHGHAGALVEFSPFAETQASMSAFITMVFALFLASFLMSMTQRVTHEVLRFKIGDRGAGLGEVQRRVDMGARECSNIVSL